MLVIKRLMMAPAVAATRSHFEATAVRMRSAIANFNERLKYNPKRQRLISPVVVFSS
jgi:hypothetical protein